MAPFTESYYYLDDYQSDGAGKTERKRPGHGARGGGARQQQSAADAEDTKRVQQCGRQAIVLMSRSWPGLAQLAAVPKAQGSPLSHSPLMVFVQTLRINNPKLRVGFLEFVPIVPMIIYALPL